jgi:hypothetical protein
MWSINLPFYTYFYIVSSSKVHLINPFATASASMALSPSHSAASSSDELSVNPASSAVL